MITVKGKCNSEIVEEVFGALVTQGVRCMDNEGTCSYGNPDGQHCAIGMLLPDTNPAIMRFSGGALELLKIGGSALGENEMWLRDNRGLICTMQSMHDVPDLKSRLRYRNRLRDNYEIDSKSVDAWVKLGED